MARTPPRWKTHVRYHSPFGSPATMPREKAERHLADDDRLWLELQEAKAMGAGETLTEAQRQHGPPWIEELPR